MSTAPWRTVEQAYERENQQRRAGSRGAVAAVPIGWHWSLVLSCGHHTRRPCRERKTEGKGSENVPAPRRVRCDACAHIAAASGARGETRGGPHPGQ